MDQIPPLNTADRASLQTALDQRATLITGSQRLARRMLGEEAQRRRAQGETVWRKPDILPWDAWLRKLHTSALASGLIENNEASILLSDVQLEALWQTIIETDLGETRALLQPTAAARQAMETHTLCLAWRLDRQTLKEAWLQDDTEAFLRWWNALRLRLKNHGLIAPAELAALAERWFERRTELRPRELWLAGFHQFTPQQQHLLDHLAALGTHVHVLPWPTHTDTKAQQLACLDRETEAIAVANWARQRLEAEPGISLGVVVPDLAERRSLLTRQLDAALDPPAQRQPGRPACRAFNISLGKALIDEPMVHDAFIVLEAAVGRLDFTRASRLLRSPFVGGAESEQSARVHAELVLREFGDVSIRTAWLAQVLGAPARKDRSSALCPKLSTYLNNLTQLADSTKKTPAAWAMHFGALLDAAGWPGERPLDSHEYQLKKKWRELLSELASLAPLLPQLGYDAALRRLRRLAAHRLFQPRSSVAPIQVMGLFEAIGQDFDALWVMGLDDESWPPAPRPDPLLPVSLQRAHQLPHASAEHERAFAQALTQRLLKAAPEVVVSWCRQKDDRVLRASPLIAHLPEQNGDALGASPPLPDQPAQLEWQEESHGPSLTATDKLFRPGKDLFVNQSNCPFKAFAIHRLGADGLVSPQPGMNPQQRGILVHRVLERLWDRAKSRDALIALDRTARRRLINACVSAALESLRARTPALFSERFAVLEQRRLEALMEQWLEQERARPVFTVVEREAEVPVDIAGHKLTLRIDRVDELPDGGRVLIDYKTGEVRIRDLRPERELRAPDPQLPLYANRFDDRLAGVLLGQVKSHQCKWAGVARGADVLSDKQVTADWPLLRRQWQDMAQCLTTELSAGFAAVDPLKHACTRCHLSSLCRINERVRRSAEIDE